ncbi:MAG: hypothetical protein HOV79_29905 [Hamadaea sp.]|nr:hypothetical protein [Hamadaea sp.]
MGTAGQVRVVRVEWRTHGPVEDCLYWPGEDDGRRPWYTEIYRRFRLSTTFVDHFGTGDRWLSVTGTPEEGEAWRQAAIVFFERARLAAVPLLRQRTVHRRLRWISWLPGLRGVLTRRQETARSAYLTEVQAAMREVRAAQAEIEPRLAAQEAARLAEGKRLYEEQEARRRAATAKAEAWQRRMAAEDAVAAAARWSTRAEDGVVRVGLAGRDGVTARHLAAADVSHVEWDAGARAAVEESVDDFAAWWERLLRIARNTAARDAAIARLVGAIDTTAAALEAAGRPGIAVSASDTSRAVRHGWTPAFDPAPLAVPAPRFQPPPTPGEWAEWHLGGVFGPYGDRVAQIVLGGVMLTVHADGYRVSHLAHTGTSDYTRHQRGWRDKTPREYADDVFPDTARFLRRQLYSEVLSCRLTEYMEPAEYVPYVAAVAELGAAGFLDLVGHHR